MADSNNGSSTPRVWLITGCSSGFGRAFAEEVLQHGDAVLATARDPGGLDAIASAAGGDAGDRFAACKLDVTSADQCLAAVEYCVERFGRLDVLVNNAGCGSLGALEELNDDEIERVLDTNVIGPLRLMRKALSHWRTTGEAEGEAFPGGLIVNMGAIAAWDHEMGFSVYGASKAALETAGGAVDREAKNLGVRVMTVVPGPFKTEFIGKSVERCTGRIAAYEKTVGKFEKVLRDMDGKQPGDPHKAGRAIIAASESKSPPSRLFLGEYAYKTIGKVLKAVNKDLDAWEDTGRPTDAK